MWASHPGGCWGATPGIRTHGPRYGGSSWGVTVGRGRLEGLLFAPSLSPWPRFRRRGKGPHRGLEGQSDARAAVPGPSPGSPGCRIRSGIAESGVSTPPRRHARWMHPASDPRAGGAPLQTAGLGAQGVGHKDRTSEQVLHVNQVEKVIPILFPECFAIVPRNHVVLFKRGKMRSPTSSCYMEFHLSGSSSLYLIWDI